MATVKLILDTRSRKKEGQYPIKLSVSHKTVTSFIEMAISVTEDQWSGKAVINHPKAKMFNSILISRLLRAENMIFHLTSFGKLRNLSQKELLYYIETNSFESETKQEYPKQYQQHWVINMDQKQQKLILILI